MNLALVRDAGSDPLQTFGELTWADDQVVLQTLERPWVPADDGALGGHPLTSCVPAGVYDLVKHDTADHPQTWALVNHALGVYHEPTDIPAGQSGRSACLIHQANLVWQLEGCIGVGLVRASLGGQPDIADSQSAFAQLKAAVPWTPGHTISITNGASS